MHFDFQRMEKITNASVSVFTIPTETPESDGTLEWNSTTMVLVEIRGAGQTGLGFTYAHRSVAEIVNDLLKYVVGAKMQELPRVWDNLTRAVRNWGRTGGGSMAIAAIDTALWDWKAKIFARSLTDLIGRRREKTEIYGSGGFTSYDSEELEAQMSGWVESGIRKVKMKVGRDTECDRHRVEFVRGVIGEEVELFVDANEAYDFVTASEMAKIFSDHGVKWFEQPFPDENLSLYRELKRNAPTGMAITTGEYFADSAEFLRALKMRAAHVLQPDATRCRGFTGLLQAAELCKAFEIPISTHCAPSLHLALACSLPGLKHMEYFFDHVRIERMLFDGVVEPKDGFLVPSDRPGIGLELKRADAERFAA